MPIRIACTSSHRLWEIISHGCDHRAGTSGDQGDSETTALLQADTSDNEIPWNGPRRVYQLAPNAARGQLYKLGPVNDYLLMK